MRRLTTFAKLALAALAPIATMACAPTLGAHVHKFTLRRVQFVKCTVIAEKNDPHFAEQSLEVCRDAFGIAQQRSPR